VLEPRHEDVAHERGEHRTHRTIVGGDSRYDRVKKLGWYAQLRVPEYWIVDPEALTLERLVLRDGAYVIAASLADDEIFRPESFEALEIALSKLWA
jgi:Uma2 family endonuclease